MGFTSASRSISGGLSVGISISMVSSCVKPNRWMTIARSEWPWAATLRLRLARRSGAIAWVHEGNPRSRFVFRDAVVGSAVTPA